MINSNCIIFQEEYEVEHELQKLGLSVAILNDAVASGALAKSNCTKYDTKGFPGNAFWSQTNRKLRETLCPEWSLYLEKGVEGIMSPCEKFIVIPCSGNAHVGRLEYNPKNKNPKGKVTSYIIEKSNQLSLLLPSESKIVAYKPYVLLYYAMGGEIRAELSVPSDIDDKGYILDWSERIILPAQDIDRASEAMLRLRKGPDLGTNSIDIPIKKKA